MNDGNFQVSKVLAQVVTDVQRQCDPLAGSVWQDPLQSALMLPLTRPGQARPAAALSPPRAYEEGHRRRESLAALEQAKAAFFQNVSEELRTPLCLMLGPTEDALAAGGALGGEDLGAVYRNQLRLLKAVNNLLDFARMEAGQAQATFERVDVAALTLELADTFRDAIERAGLRFHVDCGPLDGEVFLDRGLWQRVVLNLVSNALKFTFEGDITIVLRGAGAYFELAVRDTGTGIPPEALPRLFERFHRVPGARARTHQGSGIGLALVHEIVRIHGGSIQAASDPGQGTTFTVRIPLGKDHLPADRIGPPSASSSPALTAQPYVQEAMRWLPEAPTANDVQPEPSAGLANARILIADHNPDMRAYLRRLFSRRWTVEAVADGTAALTAARRQRPDLVIADATMPALDGFGLLRALRAEPALDTVPVILLSARAGEESRAEGLEAGADDYLVKPFSVRELVARVATHLHHGQVREAGARERKRLFDCLAQAPVPIAILRGPDHVFELANSQYARLTGKSELAGKPLRVAFPEIPSDAELFALFDRAFTSGETVFAEEYRQDLIHEDGTAKEEYWKFNLNPLRSRSGTVEGLIAVVINVTDNVRARRVMSEARAKAEAANRTKDEFLAMLGHELRNPLTPILATLQHMRLRGGETLSRRERELLERQTRQLAKMVDDLLDVSRIAQGKVKLLRKPVDLADIVSRSIDVSSPLLEERGHDLTVDVPRGLVVNGDEGRLVQVVSNLLTNAAKYTDPGGRIQILAGTEGRTALLRVRDNGVGIPTDMVAHVFDRFTQGRQSSDRPQGGLGLGLSIVQNLVQRHGGVVGARSDGPGKGSEFTVRLPMARRKSDRPKARALPGPKAKTTTNPQQILLVDDNRDIADVLAEILTTRGHTVTVAYDGPGALAAVATFRPRIALLDIGLPAMDGYELARRLRQQKGLSRLRLMALTGYGQSADKRRAERAGFSEHLVKPIEVEHLLSLIERP